MSRGCRACLFPTFCIPLLPFKYWLSWLILFKFLKQFLRHSCTFTFKMVTQPLVIWLGNSLLNDKREKTFISFLISKCLWELTFDGAVHKFMAF